MKSKNCINIKEFSSKRGEEKERNGQECTKKSWCVYLNLNLLTAGSLYQGRRKGMIQQPGWISIIQADLLLLPKLTSKCSASHTVHACSFYLYFCTH